MFYKSGNEAWRVGAESPYRSPVLHAIGEMARTVRARGGEPDVVLWGPWDGTWRRFERADAVPTAVVPESSASAVREPSKLTERMQDRRHQVLIAGLSKAGIYDLAEEDQSTVQALVERLDETSLRKVAHWLAVAGAER